MLIFTFHSLGFSMAIIKYIIAMCQQFKMENYLKSEFKYHSMFSGR